MGIPAVRGCSRSKIRIRSVSPVTRPPLVSPPEVCTGLGSASTVGARAADHAYNPTDTRTGRATGEARRRGHQGTDTLVDPASAAGAGARRLHRVHALERLLRDRIPELLPHAMVADAGDGARRDPG